MSHTNKKKRNEEVTRMTVVSCVELVVCADPMIRRLEKDLESEMDGSNAYFVMSATDASN